MRGASRRGRRSGWWRRRWRGRGAGVRGRWRTWRSCLRWPSDAPAGQARAGLDELGRRRGEVFEQARWLAASLDPDPASRPAGLVRNLSILGPFRDPGGGLTRREGPESAGQVWGDPRAAYDWGAHEVRWRSVPEVVVSARGVPLDLLIHPRKESCSYLATRVRLASPGPVVIQVAAGGSVRLIWDGADAGRTDEAHPGLVFDRLGARIEASGGDHLLAVKVCSGAIEDSGRVRIRVQTPEGAPLDLATGGDLAGARGRRQPDRVTALATPLGRALAPAAGEAGGDAGERSLAVALLRRLGQADDLRSPRAPGLLDSVAADAAVMPDRLAAAGWVAPFGAQRSGWLGLALERARSSGDLATVSFCQRVLAETRARAGFGDWALATTATPPLATDEDPEARLIRATARASLGQESIRRQALAELWTIAGSEGARASAALWTHLAWLARDAGSPGPSARDRRDCRPPARAARPGLARGARPGGPGGGVAGRGDGADERQRVRLCRRVAGGGRAAGAGRPARACRRSLPRGRPALPQPIRGLHRPGPSPVRAGRPGRRRPRAGPSARPRPQRPARPRRGDSARPAQRRRQDQPAGAGARAEPRSAPESPLLVAPAEFLARRAREPVRPGEVWSRILHRLYAERLHPDRRVSRLLHVADEVVVEPRTQAELLWSFNYEGTPEILRAVVHRADGTVERALEERVERGRARIRWRELKAGDVAEYALLSWSERPVGQRDDYPHWGFRTAGSTSTRPTLYSETVLEFPEDVRLAHDVLHGKPDRTVDLTREGRRTLRFIWDRPPNMADEPLAPDPTEILPTVVWSLYPTWGDFVRWHREATEGFTEPDDQIRRLARELTAGKNTRDEKLQAVFGYVADRIRYVNYQSGERWLPNRPQQVLARRQGDCDDKSTLLVTLLKACGIEANLVLVQTRDTLNRPALLAAAGAAIPALDHAIAFLPGAEGEPGVWLNPTAPQSRVGRLYSNEAGVPAIIVTPQGAVKTTTPAPSPEDHGRDARWQVTLTESGAGELQAEERHRGDDAFWLRAKLGESETRAQIVEREVLAHWWPSVGVDRKVDFDARFAFKPGDGGARLTYRARSDAFARRQGDSLVFPLAPVTTLTSRLAPLTRRTLPVVLPVYGPEAGAPSRDTREFEIQAPAGYRLAGLPRSGTEPGGAFGEARLESTRKSDRLVLVRSTLSIRADRVSPDQYASWRSWLSRVDSLLHQSVRFVRSQGTKVAEK